MGFEGEVRKLVEQLGAPPKTERQTLMFSATFPEEIQKLARDFLNDYIFITVGRVGGANTDIEQTIHETEQFNKREKLQSILLESSNVTQMFPSFHLWFSFNGSRRVTEKKRCMSYTLFGSISPHDAFPDFITHV